MGEQINWLKMIVEMAPQKKIGDAWYTLEEPDVEVKYQEKIDNKKIQTLKGIKLPRIT